MKKEKIKSKGLGYQRIWTMGFKPEGYPELHFKGMI